MAFCAVAGRCFWGRWRIRVLALALAGAFPLAPSAVLAQASTDRFDLMALPEAGADGAVDAWAATTRTWAEPTVSWLETTKVVVEPSAENWFGVEGYRRAVSVYSGVTWSPFANLRQDGFRLRAIGGQSLYAYSGTRYDPAANNGVWEHFSGTGRFVDALAGWQLSAGGTTLKAFGGYGYVSNTIAPYDPDTQIEGAARGIKGVLEVWQNWTPALWTSLDVSESRAHRAFALQVRTGWRIAPFGDPGWSVGPELGATGHTEATIRRLGLFVRYEAPVYEFVVSGGLAQSSYGSPMGYVTGQYLRRF